MEILKRILNKCIHAGADKAEVFQRTKNNLYIAVRDSEVDRLKRSSTGGVAIRFFSHGRMAFGSTTDLADNSIDALIAGLSKVVKKTSESEYARIPGSQQYESKLDIYGPEFIEIPIENKIEYLERLEKAAMDFDPLITKSNGASYGESKIINSLVNSEGAEISYESTRYEVGVSIIATKGREMFPGEKVFSVRHFADLPSYTEIAEKSASSAIRLIGGTPVESGDYEIIFTPSAGPSLLYGLGYGSLGEDYLKGSSFLAGKYGKQVAVDSFNVIDDPLMTRGLSSRPADDEGTASRKINLIENGIFKSPLYDYSTAAKAKTKSTGSASRDDYNSLPGIWMSNFYIAPGDTDFEDMVSSCDKGIIVEATQGWGLHSVTGQYSAGINGILVRNGKRIKPVADVTLASSAEDLLMGIEAIGNDISYYDSLNAPSLKIKRMKVGA